MNYKIYQSKLIIDNHQSFINNCKKAYLSINKDSVEQVLAEHGHLYPYHGYISIDPQNTTTIFNNGLEIKNKPGQIYIGPGRNWDENNEDWDHKVVINRKSSNPRITIAFDISDKIDKEHEELSFFPLF